MDGDRNLIERIAFASLPGNDVATARAIVERVGDVHQVMTLPVVELRVRLGMEVRMLSDDARGKALVKAADEVRFVTDHHVKAIYYTDPAYPQRLLESASAPVMLYGLGDCDLNATRVISIVGTRHATASGARWLDRMVDELSATVDNLMIVSGLAYGIDITAHRAALRNNVSTAAVLAHGLSTLYPAQHRDTAAQMVHGGGMLLTDYTSDAVIHRGNFLARNRIVAGLCDCLLVVESAVKGGAMVTARLAFENNREVLAVPGRPSDTYSAGCNRLIAMQRAQLVTAADDIVSLMRWPAGKVEGAQGALPLVLDADQQRVVDYLTGHDDGATLSRLQNDLDMPIQQLLPMLVDLDFNGVILSLPGNRYRLA